MKQAAPFLHGTLTAALRIGGSFHQGGAPRAHIASVHRRRFAGCNMELSLFAAVTPSCSTACACLQPYDIALKVLVARFLPGILLIEAFLPSIIITLHYPGITSIQRQHMIDTAVKEGAVVAHQ